MNYEQARKVLGPIPPQERSRLADAHERYMYFAGAFTDRPNVDRIAEDREAFPHLLLAFTDDGRPSLSDELCADFMVAITGLPRDWCIAWDEIEFVDAHGENCIAKQKFEAEQEALAFETSRHCGRGNAPTRGLD
jgi:hypothetical protein